MPGSGLELTWSEEEMVERIGADTSVVEKNTKEIQWHRNKSEDPTSLRGATSPQCDRFQETYIYIYISIYIDIYPYISIYIHIHPSIIHPSRHLDRDLCSMQNPFSASAPLGPQASRYQDI